MMLLMSCSNLKTYKYNFLFCNSNLPLLLLDIYNPLYSPSIKFSDSFIYIITLIIQHYTNPYIQPISYIPHHLDLTLIYEHYIPYMIDCLQIRLVQMRLLQMRLLQIQHIYIY